MTEHDELVKRLEKAAEDREFIPPKTVRAWITPRDAEEAAQAIERLERELEITKASLTDAEKAEHKLADARAEVERLKDAIEFAHSEGFEWPADPLPSEALAAPATHPFRGVSPIIDKCGECGEHPDHPIHNPAPALTIAAIKARQVSGEDKE